MNILIQCKSALFIIFISSINLYNYLLDDCRLLRFFFFLMVKNRKIKVSFFGNKILNSCNHCPRLNWAQLWSVSHLEDAWKLLLFRKHYTFLQSAMYYYGVAQWLAHSVAVSPLQSPRFNLELGFPAERCSPNLSTLLKHYGLDQHTAGTCKKWIGFRSCALCLGNATHISFFRKSL